MSATRVSVIALVSIVSALPSAAENPQGVVTELAAVNLPGTAHEVSLSADCSLAATICGNEVRIFSLPSLTEIARIPGNWACVAVNPDGRMVAFGGTWEVVQVWHRDTGEITTLNTGPNAKATDYFYTTSQVVFSPDSQSLVIGTGYNATNGTDFGVFYGLQRYSTADLHVPHAYLMSKSSTFNDIEYTPDGSKILVAGGTKGIRLSGNFPCKMYGSDYYLVDAATGATTTIETSEAHPSISTDGTSVIFMGKNCSGSRVAIQDLATQTTTLEIPVLVDENRDVQFLPEGHYAIRDKTDITIYQGAAEKRKYSISARRVDNDSFRALGTLQRFLVLEVGETDSRLILLEDTFWGEAVGAFSLSCIPGEAAPGQGVFITVEANINIVDTPTLRLNGHDARLASAGTDQRHFTFACRVGLHDLPGAAVLDVSGMAAGGVPVMATDASALTVTDGGCAGIDTCPDFQAQGEALAAFWSGFGAVPGAQWATLDLDGGGIADRFEVALAGAVICGNSPWGSEAACTFRNNVETLAHENPDAFGGTDAAEVAAALLCVDVHMQVALQALNFVGGYGVIGSAKSFAGPMSPEGDPDGDGWTNLQEYLKVIAAGGDLDEYVAAALNPLLDGSAASANGLPLDVSAVLGSGMAVVGMYAGHYRSSRRKCVDRRNIN